MINSIIAAFNKILKEGLKEDILGKDDLEENDLKKDSLGLKKYILEQNLPKPSIDGMDYLHHEEEELSLYAEMEGSKDDNGKLSLYEDELNKYIGEIIKEERLKKETDFLLGKNDKMYNEFPKENFESKRKSSEEDEIFGIPGEDSYKKLQTH